MLPTRLSIRCFSLRWCGLLLASLLLLSGKVEAQTSTPLCPEFPSCFAATAYSGQTQTAVAAPTSTPTATRDFGTLQFLDLLSTPTPEGTPGVNLSCPEESFNPNGLDPAWSVVCSRCVERVVGTKTPVFGGGFDIPSISLSTFTPIPTDYLSPTPSSTPTPTATLPSPTPTPTGGCHWVQRFDFNGFGWNPPITAINACTGSWTGTQWRDGAGTESGCAADGFGNRYRQAGISIAVPASGAYYSVKVNYDLTKGGFANSGHPARILSMTSGCGASSTANPSVSSGTNQTWTVSTVCNGAAGSIWIQIVSSSATNVVNLGGSAYINWVEFEGTGANPWTGAVGCPTATPTPTNTPTPTTTPLPGTATATPEYWATAFPLYAGLSINCEVPKYINLETPVAEVEVGASGESSCYTIIPQVNIGFSAVNFILETLISFSIPDFNVEGMEICFVGISLNVEIFGVQADMAVWLGFPLIAFVFRWVMRN